MDDLIRRSDAIRIASGYCHWSNIPDELAKLPSVKPTPCEDAISRKAVLDCLTATKLKKFDFILQAREEIKNLPSVSTEKTGRWKRRIVDSGYNADWSCSCCGYKVKTDFVNFKYCPNCGARMEVEDG